MNYMLVVLTVFYVLQQEVQCFENNDDAVALNQKCDKANNPTKEGNSGQSPWFPWLGILRVHSHLNHSFTVGLTGVVLVKEKTALASAMDIAKVPQSTLRDDSKVMFIFEENNPSYCKVIDQVMHPEYDVLTRNTIAILTLSRMEGYIAPICWPTSNFNTNNELYLIGYTDEHMLLEKTLNRLTYVDKNLCFEFYKRSNLTRADLSEPVNYLCGFSMSSRKDCVWENGRVVASNATGDWTLVGLLIAGPGCASPARFLDTTAYMPWIMTTMNIDETPGVDSFFRRSAHGTQNKSTDTKQQE